MNQASQKYSVDDLLRQDRMPHIWCPGCGLGTTLRSFLGALLKSGLDPDKFAIVSGIGCSGRAAGYIKLDSFHTTHGRAIPFATGLKLANPELKVIVFSGDGDLLAIGGDHFIHAARRNMDLTIVCVNNFNYGMTGGQLGPTTPLAAQTATSPYGNYEPPFNIPHLAAAAGATYISRWTAMHIRRLEKSLTEAILKKGFSLVEVISPCPMYGRMNRLASGLEMMKYYREHSVIRHGADTRDVEIKPGGEIAVGKFIDVERPTFSDVQRQILQKAFTPEPEAHGAPAPKAPSVAVAAR